MSGDWLFDLGNSRLKLAPLGNDGGVGAVQAIDPARPGWESDLPHGATAWLASVVPAPLRVAVLDALAQRFRRIAIARPSACWDGLRIAYAAPERLGVDRFLALLGARAAEPGPVLVVAVGTALTLDLVDAAGVHRGGRIAPSPTLMRQSLHARAPHLPVDGGDGLGFATDTAGALASGCDGAAVALIAATRAEAQALLGAAPALLLHGGGADALLPYLGEARLCPALVLEGLARWSLPLRAGGAAAAP